jgi:prevent-host-death family protein
MERIPVRELNQHTSAVLARVRRGETLEVTVRGEAVARIAPMTGRLTFLEELAAEGWLLPAEVARGPMPAPVAAGDPGVEVAAELSAARDEERW